MTKPWETIYDHAQEILREVRTAGRFVVLAEAGNDGTWRGAARVSRGTGSLLAHEGHAVAFYRDGDRFLSLSRLRGEISDCAAQEEVRP